MDRGPHLLSTSGLLSGQQFAITAEGLRIGREPGNEVHIDDTGVSRQHARVLLHNGAVWVQDAGSRNGIFVNGERVPDHKQLKVGDALTVGGHAFEIVPSSAAAAASAPRPAPVQAQPRGTVAPKWKVWPFAIAFLLALGFILCLGLFGAVRDNDAAEATPRGPAYSLTTLLDPAPPGAPTAPPTVAQALAVVAGEDASRQAALPDAPAGTSARQLLDTAQVMYDSGRLADARLNYQMALKLDPPCEICTLRISRIQTELSANIQQNFDAGMRSYDAMQFTQAIGSWETVLMLTPDPQDPMHVQALEYLKKAREGAAGR